MIDMSPKVMNTVLENDHIFQNAIRLTDYLLALRKVPIVKSTSLHTLGKKQKIIDLLATFLTVLCSSSDPLQPARREANSKRPANQEKDVQQQVAARNLFLTNTRNKERSTS